MDFSNNINAFKCTKTPSNSIYMDNIPILLINSAIANDDLIRLKQALLLNKLNIPDDICVRLIESDSINSLIFFESIDYKIPNNMCDIATINNSIKCFKYGMQNNYKIDHTTYELANMFNRTQILDLINIKK